MKCLFNSLKILALVCLLLCLFGDISFIDERGGWTLQADDQQVEESEIALQQQDLMNVLNGEDPDFTLTQKQQEFLKQHPLTEEKREQMARGGHITAQKVNPVNDVYTSLKVGTDFAREPGWLQVMSRFTPPEDRASAGMEMRADLYDALSTSVQFRSLSEADRMKTTQYVFNRILMNKIRAKMAEDPANRNTYAKEILDNKDFAEKTGFIANNASKEFLDWARTPVKKPDQEAKKNFLNYNPSSEHLSEQIRAFENGFAFSTFKQPKKTPLSEVIDRFVSRQFVERKTESKATLDDVRAVAEALILGNTEYANDLAQEKGIMVSETAMSEAKEYQESDSREQSYLSNSIHDPAGNISLAEMPYGFSSFFDPRDKAAIGRMAIKMKEELPTLWEAVTGGERIEKLERAAESKGFFEKFMSSETRELAQAKEDRYILQKRLHHLIENQEFLSDETPVDFDVETSVTDSEAKQSNEITDSVVAKKTAAAKMIEKMSAPSADFLMDKNYQDLKALEEANSYFSKQGLGLLISGVSSGISNDEEGPEEEVLSSIKRTKLKGGFENPLDFFPYMSSMIKSLNKLKSYSNESVRKAAIEFMASGSWETALTHYNRYKDDVEINALMASIGKQMLDSTQQENIRNVLASRGILDDINNSVKLLGEASLAQSTKLQILIDGPDGKSGQKKTISADVINKIEKYEEYMNSVQLVLADNGHFIEDDAVLKVMENFLTLAARPEYKDTPEVQGILSQALVHERSQIAALALKRKLDTNPPELSKKIAQNFLDLSLKNDNAVLAEIKDSCPANKCEGQSPRRKSEKGVPLDQSPIFVATQYLQREQDNTSARLLFQVAEQWERLSEQNKCGCDRSAGIYAAILRGAVKADSPGSPVNKSGAFHSIARSCSNKNKTATMSAAQCSETFKSLGVQNPKEFFNYLANGRPCDGANTQDFSFGKGGDSVKSEYDICVSPAQQAPLEALNPLLAVSNVLNGKAAAKQDADNLMTYMHTLKEEAEKGHLNVLDNWLDMMSKDQLEDAKRILNSCKDTNADQKKTLQDRIDAIERHSKPGRSNQVQQNYFRTLLDNNATVPGFVLDPVSKSVVPQRAPLAQMLVNYMQAKEVVALETTKFGKAKIDHSILKDKSDLAAYRQYVDWFEGSEYSFLMDGTFNEGDVIPTLIKYQMAKGEDGKSSTEQFFQSLQKFGSKTITKSGKTSEIVLGIPFGAKDMKADRNDSFSVDEYTKTITRIGFHPDTKIPDQSGAQRAFGLSIDRAAKGALQRLYSYCAVPDSDYKQNGKPISEVLDVPFVVEYDNAMRLANGLRGFDALLGRVAFSFNASVGRDLTSSVAIKLAKDQFGGNVSDQEFRKKYEKFYEDQCADQGLMGATAGAIKDVWNGADTSCTPERLKKFYLTQDLMKLRDLRKKVLADHPTMDNLNMDHAASCAFAKNMPDESNLIGKLMLIPELAFQVGSTATGVGIGVMAASNYHGNRMQRAREEFKAERTKNDFYGTIGADTRSASIEDVIAANETLASGEKGVAIDIAMAGLDLVTGGSSRIALKAGLKAGLKGLTRRQIARATVSKMKSAEKLAQRAINRYVETHKSLAKAAGKILSPEDIARIEARARKTELVKGFLKAGEKQASLYRDAFGISAREMGKGAVKGATKLATSPVVGLYKFGKASWKYLRKNYNNPYRLTHDPFFALGRGLRGGKDLIADMAKKAWNKTPIAKADLREALDSEFDSLMRSATGGTRPYTLAAEEAGSDVMKNIAARRASLKEFLRTVPPERWETARAVYRMHNEAVLALKQGEREMAEHMLAVARSLNVQPFDRMSKMGANQLADMMQKARGLVRQGGSQARFGQALLDAGERELKMREALAPGEDSLRTVREAIDGVPGDGGLTLDQQLAQRIGKLVDPEDARKLREDLVAMVQACSEANPGQGGNIIHR